MKGIIAKAAKLNTFLLASALLIVGCAQNSTISTQRASDFLNRRHVTVVAGSKVYKSKNPSKVKIYQAPHEVKAPYKVIGVASVSKYNLLGKKRDDESAEVMLKKLAASVGGDGLIDINSTTDEVNANIIRYQKIML